MSELVKEFLFNPGWPYISIIKQTNMTQKLIYKTEVVDPFGNRKLFRAYVNTETGLLRLFLEGKSGTNFAVSNMQCKGWAPDVYEEISDNPTHHLNEFIDSGLYRRDHSTTKTFQI